MLKEKIREIIDQANSAMKALNDKMAEMERSKMYTPDFLLTKKAELKQECIRMRDEAAEKVGALFNEEIKKANDEDFYTSGDDLKTSNMLKMIELSNKTMAESELKYLIRINKNNPIVRRVLYSIAEQKGVYIEREPYLPNSIELEDLKYKFMSIITSSDETGIDGLRIELLFKYMQLS